MQYNIDKVTVGIFNNRNLITNLRFDFPSCSKLSKNLPKYDPNYISLFTAQKMKFSITVFFSKCDQIHNFLWIWSHLLKKFLIENFIFCAMIVLHFSQCCSIFKGLCFEISTKLYFNYILQFSCCSLFFWARSYGYAVP